MTGLTVHTLTIFILSKAKFIRSLFNQLLILLTVFNIIHTVLLFWDSLGKTIQELYVVHDSTCLTAKVWGVGMDIHR